MRLGQTLREDVVPKLAEPLFIDSTAGQVAAELSCFGVDPGRRVTITVEPAEPDDWIAKDRRFSRPKVIAKSWSDNDIDRLIEQALRELGKPLVRG